MSESYRYHAEGSGDGRPLVFVFHGTGGTRTSSCRSGASLMPGAAIVAPRGDVSASTVRSRFFRRTGEGVYDMDDLAARTAAMAGFVEAHAAIAKPSAVIGLGYSNGANILASVVFSQPALFDRAVLMHPLIPWQPEPAPVRTRVLITAGERDPICPPEETRRLEAWFADQGAEVTTHWHPGGHEIGRSEVAAIAGFLR